MAGHRHFGTIRKLPSGLRHTGNDLASKVPGTTIRDLMSRMGHDSTRAAMIYLHGSPGADRLIADALPVEFEEDRDGHD